MAPKSGNRFSDKAMRPKKAAVAGVLKIVRRCNTIPKVPPGEAAHFFSARARSPKSGFPGEIVRKTKMFVKDPGCELASIADLCARRSRFRAG
jgi:hypothetical protein